VGDVGVSHFLTPTTFVLNINAMGLKWESGESWEVFFYSLYYFSFIKNYFNRLV